MNPPADCKHRTPNIEHRILYSACLELFLSNGLFKTTERSDSIIRHSSLFISHSLKFYTRFWVSGKRGAKS
ncbi:hypothetical protein D1AOALGA4SA_871 [Olavius algarvensis Delta 1 endosymbiont]|nr:hypothetical protein D1AOALGA4SA_871 [Olavius algarvensis Delta 1 endosymbiont]